MRHRLIFSGSRWNALVPALRSKAFAAVRNIDLHALQTAAAAEVDAIARVNEIVIASLKPISHGETRLVDQVQRVVGGTRTDKVTVLDVSVPFNGSKQSFRLQPTAGEAICVEHELRDHELILTVPYDSDAQGAVDSLVMRISENLDRLRSEVAAFEISLRGAMRSAAIARLKREGVFDVGLKFAVRH